MWTGLVDADWPEGAKAKDDRSTDDEPSGYDQGDLPRPRPSGRMASTPLMFPQNQRADGTKRATSWFPSGQEAPK